MRKNSIILCGGVIFMNLCARPSCPRVGATHAGQCTFSFLGRVYPKGVFVPLRLGGRGASPHTKVLRLSYAFVPMKGKRTVVCGSKFVCPRSCRALLSLFNERGMFRVAQRRVCCVGAGIFSVSPRIIISRGGFVHLGAFVRRM